jgi:hypothetical protein
MTDYNDKAWHDWNGGDNPVHPKTTVRFTFRDRVSNEIRLGFEAASAMIDWERVVKFCVVREYGVPHVIWVNDYGRMSFVFETQEAARESAAKRGNRPVRTAVCYVEASHKGE